MASYNESLTILFLITMFFSLTATGDERAKPPGCGKINTVKDICTMTTFPSSCYNTLVKTLAPNVTTQPEIIYVKSVQVAMAEVSRTALKFSKDGTLQTVIVAKSMNKKMALLAMQDCREVLSHAIRRFNQSSSAVEGSSIKESYDNIRTWLSSAETDIETCKDGFVDLAEVVPRNIVVGKLKKSKEYASNTLAMATKIGECEGATRYEKGIRMQEHS